MTRRKNKNPIVQKHLVDKLINEDEALSNIVNIIITNLPKELKNYIHIKEANDTKGKKDTRDNF